MKIFYLIVFVLFSVATKTQTQTNQTNKSILIKNIEKNLSIYNKVALKIWEYAEGGFKEEKSSKELITLLKENGFVITEGVAGMPTAFIAEYGKSGPIIGVLGEYDALPGLSQTHNAV